MFSHIFVYWLRKDKSNALLVAPYDNKVLTPFLSMFPPRSKRDNALWAMMREGGLHVPPVREQIGANVEGWGGGALRDQTTVSISPMPPCCSVTEESVDSTLRRNTLGHVNQFIKINIHNSRKRDDCPLKRFHLIFQNLLMDTGTWSVVSL